MKYLTLFFACISTIGAVNAALMPRASPTPCAQNYVCPTPKPYPDVADTGDDPGPTRFKCRIGQSVSDPNFAFCIYEKVRVALGPVPFHCIPRGLSPEY